MLNNEVNLRTSAEICSQIGSYFQIVDNCIAVADTNRAYVVNPQTSYSPSPPIASGSYTSVIISPNTHNTADIYNGFIRADLQFKPVINKKIADSLTRTIDGEQYDFDKIWFGFKDSRDAIEKYELVANGQSIYTQNYGCEESFLTACCANETTKRADIYSKARHKDIWDNKCGCRCGIVVNWPQNQLDLYNNGNDGWVTINLKIDLRRFLPLSNIKYLPAFAGKLELRLYFSCAAMLYCPVGPSQKLRNNPYHMNQLVLNDITNEFTPIGEEIVMWCYNGKFSKIRVGDGTATYPDEKYTDDAGAEQTKKGGIIPIGTAVWIPEVNAKAIGCDFRKFTVSDYRVSECSSIIPCFGILDNVYNALVQRYSSHPLTFPTQTMSFYTTTKALKNIDDKATITITPRFVDSIFCLFPLHHTHHTYFKNPLFTKFQLNCGNYGNMPAKAFGTTGEYPEFLEYCQNAMNVNGEQTGFNKEVIASLINTKQYGMDTIGNYSDDRTSFFMGFATETDGTYQQGLTSLAPINFEIIVSQNVKNTDFAHEVDTPPLLCLLYDSNISILVKPNGVPPSVAIGTYDITTPD